VTRQDTYTKSNTLCQQNVLTMSLVDTIRLLLFHTRHTLWHENPASKATWHFPPMQKSPGMGP